MKRIKIGNQEFVWSKKHLFIVDIAAPGKERLTLIGSCEKEFIEREATRWTEE